MTSRIRVLGNLMNRTSYGYRCTCTLSLPFLVDFPTFLCHGLLSYPGVERVTETHVFFRLWSKDWTETMME